MSHRTLTQDIRCVGHWKSRRHGGVITLLVAQVSESEIWADGRARYLEDEYRCYALEEMPEGGGYKMGQANGETCVGMTRSFRHLYLKRERREHTGALPRWLRATDEWKLIPRNSETIRSGRDVVRIGPSGHHLTMAGERYRLLEVKRSDEKGFEATLVARGEECGPPKRFCLRLERWGEMVNLQDLRATTARSADDCDSGGTPKATLVAASGVRSHAESEEVSAAPAASPRTMPNMLEARNAFDDERHDSATLTEVAERVVRRLTVLNQEYMLKTAGIVRSMAEELDEEPN